MTWADPGRISVIPSSDKARRNRTLSDFRATSAFGTFTHDPLGGPPGRGPPEGHYCQPRRRRMLTLSICETVDLRKRTLRGLGECVEDLVDPHDAHHSVPLDDG